MSNACDVTKEACTAQAATTATTECCEIPEKLLCLADEAWKEVLKDKIKQEIEKSSGPKLSALAKLVAETNQRRWTHLIEGKQKCDEYKQQVKEALLALTQ
jgi:hypothetical protein